MHRRNDNMNTTIITIICTICCVHSNHWTSAYAFSSLGLSSKANLKRSPCIIKVCRSLSMQEKNKCCQLVSLQSKREEDDENFKPNKPISLPSLENPPDADPLYNTCRSVTGMEQQEKREDDDDGKEMVLSDENLPFVPNKPIELNSLKGQGDDDRSFLGIQPRALDTDGNGNYDNDVPLLMDTGLGVFTSSVILGGSIYFILAVFLDNGDGVDPTMIPLSF